MNSNMNNTEGIKDIESSESAQVLNDPVGNARDVLEAPSVSNPTQNRPIVDLSHLPIDVAQSLQGMTPEAIYRMLGVDDVQLSRRMESLMVSRLVL